MYNQTAWDIANELEAFYAQPVPAVETVPAQFNMCDWGTVRYDGTPDCRTVACLAGSITLVRNPQEYLQWARAHGWDDIATNAEHTLGLSENESHDLFTPDCVALGQVTIDEAIKTLRHFAQTGEIDWSHASSYFGEV